MINILVRIPRVRLASVIFGLLLVTKTWGITWQHVRCIRELVTPAVSMVKARQHLAITGVYQDTSAAGEI